MTPQEFKTQLLNVLKQHEKTWQGSLETYLLALWRLVEKQQHITPSFEVFITLFDTAFSATPALFNDAWLTSYTDTLNWADKGGEYVLVKFEGETPVIAERNLDPFRIMKHTLLFHITDLHRMGSQHDNNPLRHMGVKSPTGHAWYNFTPFNYLERIAQAVVDHIKDPNALATSDWADLATLLEFGRVYQ